VRSRGLIEINSYSVVVQLKVEFPPNMEMQIPLEYYPNGFHKTFEYLHITIGLVNQYCNAFMWA